MKLHLKNKKVVIDKLPEFGFERHADCFRYTTDLIDGQLALRLIVAQDGTVDAEVTDAVSGEPYVLHLMDSAQGAFVGRVRDEYNAVLERFEDTCCDMDVFKTHQAKRLIAYVRDTYGDELEYLWEKFPENAIWRRKDNKKWYAAVLTVSGRKLGLDTDEIVEIIDLRMKPEDIVSAVDNKTYFPGWHMNKKHWITVVLDGSVEFGEICRRLDESYKIAKK